MFDWNTNMPRLVYVRLIILGDKTHLTTYIYRYNSRFLAQYIII